MSANNMANAFRRTTPHDAQAIQDEQDLINSLNAEHEGQKWRRVGIAIRDAAIVSTIVVAWVVGLLLWGRA